MAMLARLPINQKKDAQALLESCQSVLDPGTSLVMLTGRNVELGLNEQLRGGMVVVSAVSPKADRWFTFEPPVDFTHCMPPEQEEGMVVEPAR